MIWILIILLIAIAIFFSGCKPNPNPEPEPGPEPIPDPFYYKWQLVKTDTERWAKYFEYMQRITTDTRMAQEMLKTDATGKKFYVWTAEIGDYWDLPDEVWEKGKVDCLEENTEILIKDGVKKIKDLKEGDLVLSYNYDLEEYKYKKVINVWDKGILDGYQIRLTNAHSIIATDDHKFYCRFSEESSKKYEIKRLKDIRLDYWPKRQLYCVHLLPEGNIDINKDLAYLYGIYIAEGYSDESHVFIAQDKKDIRGKIEKVLDNLNVPYSKSKRTKHAFYNILESDIKHKLKEFGSNSFNKRLPEEVLNWNKKSLKKLIEGMLDGDGTDCTNYKNNYKNQYVRNDLWEYSTSSEQVAKIFNIIVRKVYGNCYYYKQLNHQGVGKQPIWRLRFNPNTLSNKREIYKNISTVSISRHYLKEVKGKHYYDIEIEDNHNFILAESGVISHNCDGFARLTSDGLARFAQYPDVWWCEYYGYYRDYNFTSLERAKHIANQMLGLLKGEALHLDYTIKLAGHAITVYKKNEELLAFSNTNWWWNQNFQDFVSIGEMTFPEGIILIRCRHWDTGVLQWVQEAPDGEILEGSNIFDRGLKYMKGVEVKNNKMKRR